MMDGISCTGRLQWEVKLDDARIWTILFVLYIHAFSVENTTLRVVYEAYEFEFWIVVPDPLHHPSEA